MKKILSRFLISATLLTFVGGGLLPLLPQPKVAAASSFEYAFVRKDKGQNDGTKNSAFDKAVKDIEDDSKSSSSNSVFDDYVVLVRNTDKNHWLADGAVLTFKDSNQPSGSDDYARYAFSYYCYDGSPTLEKKEGLYGTYRVGVSVALPFDNHDNYNFSGKKNIEAVSFHSEIDYQPKSKSGANDENDQMSKAYLQYGYNPKFDGDVKFDRNTSDGGSGQDLKDDVTNDVTLFAAGGSETDFDKSFFNLPNNLKLFSKNGTNLLNGCESSFNGGPIGAEQLRDDRNKTIPNYVVQAIPPKWLAVLDSKKVQDDISGSGSQEATIIYRCEAEGFSLSWLICPVTNKMAEAADGVKAELANQLNFGSTSSKTTEPGGVFCSPGKSNETCEVYKAAWSNVRNIALGLMVVAGLVVIISQMLGMELLSAYTVRKVLPRILIVAIGITLSWQIMEFVVIFINDLGAGIGALMQAPFTAINPDSDIGDAGWLQNIFLVSAALWAAGGISIMGIFALLFTAFLAFFVAFVVIVLRNILLTLLVILAPIAIVMYILPNTEKYYKMWWGNFIKALLMYPIIMAMIAAGAIFSKIALTSDSSIKEVVALVAYFAPYLMIPITFRLAGGLMNATGSFVNSKAQPAFNAATGFRANSRKKQATSAVDRARTGRVFQNAPTTSRRGRVNSAIQSAAHMNQAGINPAKWGERMGTAKTLTTLSQMQKVAEQSQAVKSFSVNDGLINAYNSGKGTERDWRTALRASGMNDKQVNESVALIRAAERDMGAAGLNMHSAIANAGTGTGYALERDAVTGEITGGGAGERDRRIAEAAGGSAIMQGYGVAKSRQAGESAKRTDLASSFGTVLEGVQSIDAAKGDSAKQAAVLQATLAEAEKGIFTKSAYEIMGGRGESVAAHIPAINDRIANSMANEQLARGALWDAQEKHNEAIATNDPVRIETANKALETAQKLAAATHQESMQALAFTDNLHHTAQSVSPEGAKILADGVMSNPIKVGNETLSVRQLIDRAKNDEYFKQTKYVYSSEYAEKSGGSAGGEGGGKAH